MSDKSIKIIFFGNTEFSNPVLIKCAEYYNVCSVVTNPSKKMGRGQKFVDTPVKILAKNFLNTNYGQYLLKILES